MVPNLLDSSRLSLKWVGDPNSGQNRWSGSVHSGRPATYFLNYGNKGNLDMPAPLISLATVPSSGNTYIRFNDRIHGRHRAGHHPCYGTGKKAGYSPTGSSFSREVQVYTNDANEFALTATPYGGDPVYSPSTIASVVDAAAPSPGLSLGMRRLYPARIHPSWDRLDTAGSIPLICNSRVLRTGITG